MWFLPEPCGACVCGWTAVKVAFSNSQTVYAGMRLNWDDSYGESVSSWAPARAVTQRGLRSHQSNPVFKGGSFNFHYQSFVFISYTDSCLYTSCDGECTDLYTHVSMLFLLTCIKMSPGTSFIPHWAHRHCGKGVTWEPLCLYKCKEKPVEL